MVYENGGFKTSYTYGANGRISQMTEHLEDEINPVTGKTISTTANAKGENINSDIAVEKLGKLYYHLDRLGSTAFITDESGMVRSYATYDEWGNVREGGSHDVNIASIDATAAFTTYTYDKILDKYFAQYRMYDAEVKRFTAEDPVKDGVNWYNYVANRPLVMTDPMGLFLAGTRLVEGAQGDNVMQLHEALLQLGYFVPSDSSIEAVQEYNSGVFGSETLAAVNRFKADNQHINNGTAGGVDAQVWSALGLFINKTIQEEFFSNHQKDAAGSVVITNPALTFTINGNDIVIDYHPNVYILEEYTEYGYFIDIQCERAVSQVDYNSHIQRMRDGFDMWEKTLVDIQGVNVNVTINFNPVQVNDRYTANVVLTENNNTGAKVGTSLFWDSSSDQRVLLNYDNTLTAANGYYGTTIDMYKHTAGHEFGHVLGVFDAYGYGVHTSAFKEIGELFGPTAPLSRAASDNLMRQTYIPMPKITENEIEMLIYAWSENELQLYTDSWLGQTSQAFFN